MKYLEISLPSPADNLACDEALLESAEAGLGGEVLRFWSSPSLFVAVGYANHVAVEANVSACEKDQIGIFRRCTGGGTVLQGPGCLNYSLILAITDSGPLQTITGTNRFILERQKAALDPLLSHPVEIQGHTDLAIQNLKFSGNAQRRRRRFCLFHGSLLLNFDLALIEKYLPMPSKQPGYRDDRSHGDFLVNLNLAPKVVQESLRAVWQAAEPLSADDIPMASVDKLVTTKYSTREWNYKL